MKKFFYLLTAVFILLQMSSASLYAAEGQKETTKVDLDLTKMSSTFVYSQIFNMMVEPEQYLGKTIKMKGLFASYDLPPEFGRKKSFAVIILDATACCQQGIEFIWEGYHPYPQDYPKEGNPITVTGVFKMYKVQNYDCFCLVASDVQF